MPACYEPFTSATEVPPCGMWLSPSSVCCTQHTDVCAPTGTPWPGMACAPPSASDLVRLATTLLNLAVGGGFNGWCPKTVRYCLPSSCGCCTGSPVANCSPCGDKCETRKRVRIDTGSSPLPVLDICEVRTGSPVDGPLVTGWRWVDGWIESPVAGWPAGEMYVTYRTAGVPLGGPAMVSRLVCQILSLSSSRSGACGGPVGTSWDYPSAVADPEEGLPLLFADPIISAWVQSTKAMNERSRTGGWWIPGSPRAYTVRGAYV